MVPIPTQLALGLPQLALGRVLLGCVWLDRFAGWPLRWPRLCLALPSVFTFLPHLTFVPLIHSLPLNSHYLSNSITPYLSMLSMLYKLDQGLGKSQCYQC